ncbi:MAG: hypothetical protein ACRELF_07720 [Gemmataceae bacterium]
MQTPSPNFDAWRELRLLCRELMKILDPAPARYCFDGAPHQLARDMGMALHRCGVARGRDGFSYPLDWIGATRENPGPLATYFADFPQLDKAEALSFHAPAGTQWQRIILDAWDADDKPLRFLVDRRGWGTARRNVLSILRRWIRFADGHLATLEKDKPDKEGQPKGRRKSSATADKDAKLVEDWKRSHASAGEAKKDFCRRNGIAIKDLEAAQARLRTNRNRARTQ